MGLVKSVTSCSDGLFHGPGTGFGREGLRGIICGAACQAGVPGISEANHKAGSKDEMERVRAERR